MKPSDFDFKGRMAHHLSRWTVSKEDRQRMDEETLLREAARRGDAGAIKKVKEISERIHTAYEARPKRRIDQQERRMLKRIGGCRRGCRFSAWVFLDQPPDRIEIRGTHNGFAFTLAGYGPEAREQMRWLWLRHHRDSGVLV